MIFFEELVGLIDDGFFDDNPEIDKIIENTETEVKIFVFSHKDKEVKSGCNKKPC